MADEKIKLTDDEVDEFYERLGSKHFALQSEVVREYGKNKIDIYFRSVGFASTVVGTIGIIAGFGFTAFPSVESKLLFFIGEGILFYSIIHGLTWAQNIYNGEFQSLSKSQEKHKMHFKERNDQFKKAWNELSKSNEVEKSELLKLQEIDNKTPELFSSPQTEQEKPRDIFSKKLYYLMIVGGVLLFASFFICNLINFLFY
jgi:hypothetical protein